LTSKSAGHGHTPSMEEVIVELYKLVP